METPPVGICITTYNRYPQIAKTIEGLQTHLTYSGQVWFHLADDGSPNGYLDQVKAIIDPKYEVTVTNAMRKGVGHSKNIALTYIFTRTPLVLLMEDDWYLNQPLNLDRYVQALVENDSAGMIRFGYLSTDMSAHLVGRSDMTYLRLVRGSGVYVYSGQVSLRHQRFYDRVGFHAEGITPGEEELEMCKRYNATDLAPEILWPGEFGFHYGQGPFSDIGSGVSQNNIQPE